MQQRARLRAQAVLAASRRLNTLIATARDGRGIAVTCSSRLAGQI